MICESVKEEIFLKATLIASSFSGFIGKLISHPIDTIKAKAQVLNKINKFSFSHNFEVDCSTLSLKKLVSKRTIMKTIESTFKNEGMKGFFSGVGVSTVIYIEKYFKFIFFY